jgi:hypothetical protein
MNPAANSEIGEYRNKEPYEAERDVDSTVVMLAPKRRR